MGDTDLTRRDLFRVAGATAAATAAASVTTTGCASMPRSGRAPTIHPCDHGHCRYYDADSGGHCTLEVRVAGGRP